MVAPGKNKPAAEVEPMEEKQEFSVNVKLGKTHYEWLIQASKERFGLANQAGLLRLLVHEKWQAAEIAAAGAPPASTNHS